MSSIMVTLIGLCGRKGSGKSTAGRVLVDQFGLHEMAFADPLKKGLQAMFGFEEDQLWGERKDVLDPHWKITPRSILQYMGTEVFREAIPVTFGWTDEQDPRRSPWVYQMERQLVRVWKEQPTQSIVITDVRFPDEVNLIRKYGGRIWSVRRPSLDTLQDTADVHCSEGRTDLTPDRTLLNDGSKAAFLDHVLQTYQDDIPQRPNEAKFPIENAS